MKAIILNSGVGSRLGDHTKDKTKCMVLIKENISIIQYQLAVLKAAGIQEIIITTGYMKDVLEDYISTIINDISVTFVHNEDYSRTNYIKSLDLIGDIEEDILLFHGDLIFTEGVLDMILRNKDSCMIIDRTLPLPEKDFKAKMNGDRILSVGVQFFGPDCVAAQPLYKLKHKDWVIWKNRIHEFCMEGNDKVYAEEALNSVSDTLILCGVDAAGQLCSEIDNEEDLYNIRRILRKGDQLSG